MSQIDYDYNYNDSISNSDKIYRLDIKEEHSTMAIICRPVAELFVSSSPHIKQSAIKGNNSIEKVVKIENNGSFLLFNEKCATATEGIGEVFSFEMVEGTSDALKNKENILIPNSLKKRLLGNLPALNKQIFINDIPLNIGGVYTDFAPNTSIENIVYSSLGTTDNDNWENFDYNLYVLLDNSNSRELIVDNYMNTLHQSIWSGYGDPKETEFMLTALKELHFIQNILWDNTPKTSYTNLIAFFLIAVIIITIAAINFLNFNTSLIPIRIRGFNTKRILGANIRKLQFSLFGEAFTISFLSFALSIILIYIYNYSNFTLTEGEFLCAKKIWIYILTFFISIVVSFISSFLPIISLTSFQPSVLLNSKFNLSMKGRNTRNILIGFQYISSFVLIITSLFMLLQNKYISRYNLVYETDNLIIVSINSEINKNRNSFYNELISLSSVQNISFANFLLSGSDQFTIWSKKYRGESIDFQCLFADSAFMNTMRIPITESSSYQVNNKSDKLLVFNELSKAKYHLIEGEKIEDFKIEGFIPDVNFNSLRKEVSPMAFLITNDMQFKYIYIKFNSGKNMSQAYIEINSLLNKLDFGYPFKVEYYDTIIKQAYNRENQTTLLFLFFSLIAIFISTSGVFNISIFESEYRKKEVGLRKVMGASIFNIIILFNQKYIKILLFCFMLSIPVSLFLVIHWLNNFTYKIPIYWWAFLCVLFLIALINILTITFQVWRSACMNPIESIKSE